MNRQPILLLDHNPQRCGLLEQELTRQSLEVFRIQRGREVAALIPVIHPEWLIVAIDEIDGLDFYQRYAQNPLLSAVRCILLGPSSRVQARETDISLDASLPPQQIAARILQALSSKAPAPPRKKTIPQPLSPVDPTPKAIPAERSPRPPPRPQRRTGSHKSIQEWKGTLVQLDPARLFSILIRRRAKGKLLLTRNIETRRIWFMEGKVVSADSNHPDTQFPQALVEEGLLPPSSLTRAREVLSGPRPGDRLYELGLLHERHQSERVNRLHLERICLLTFHWEDGGFCFIPGTEDMVGSPLPLEMNALLLRGIREQYRLERLSRILGSATRIPQWFAGRQPEQSLQPSETEQRILSLLDGQRSLGELARAAGTEPVEVYRLVYALMLVGSVNLEEQSSSSATRRSTDLIAQARSPSSETLSSFRKGPPLRGDRLRRSSSELFQVQGAALTKRRPAPASPPTPPARQTLPFSPSPGSRTPKSLPAHPYPSSATDSVTPRKPINPIVFENTPTPQPGAVSTLSSDPTPATSKNSRLRTPPVGQRPLTGLWDRASFRQPSAPRPQVELPSRPSLGPEPRKAAPESHVLQEQVDEKYHQAMTADYFRILGVSRGASEIEIRQAYNRLKQEFNEERFPEVVLNKIRSHLTEINQTLREAYEVLGDPALRSLYQRNLPATSEEIWPS